jgi:hypothetical protein
MASSSPTRQKLPEKRKQWLEALSGSDPNSINRQLTQLTWDSAAYRVINESRRLAKPVDPSDPQGRVQLSGLVHNLIERGFFVSQMAAIRRLTDKYPLEGGRSVYSLIGLLDDLIEHRHLITRRSIFDAEKIEYDSMAIEKRFQDFIEETHRTGQKAYGIPHDCSTIPHNMRHAHFDFLAGVESSMRHPSDQIRQELFERLTKRISDASKNVINHVNKFVAHAATPESRAGASAANMDVTLGYLWDAQKCLCEVAGFLSIYVLGDAQLSFLPIPQYDQFQYIERPLVNHANISGLKEVWTDFSQECIQWGRWGPDAYRAEFG